MTRKTRNHHQNSYAKGLATLVALGLVSVVGRSGVAGGPGPEVYEGEPRQLTAVQELLAQWGQTCPRSDLNSDGVVNVPDLLTLLAGLAPAGGRSGPDIGDVGNPDSPEPADSKQRPSLDEMMAEWGHTCPRYDLNGDRVVSVPDLLILLADMDAPSPVDELTAQWGQTCPKFDLNGDRVVNVPDLLILLSKGTAVTAGGGGGPSTGQDRTGDVGDQNTPEPDDGSLSSLVDQLLASWGQTCPRYDLNGDRVVSVPDLLILLAELAPGSGG